MFRLWGKIVKENRILRESVIEDASSDTRTHKIFRALESVCSEFDLAQPIWLDKNISDFKRISRTRFGSDCFIETIDFDHLEIEVLEED